MSRRTLVGLVVAVVAVLLVAGGVSAAVLWGGGDPDEGTERPGRAEERDDDRPTDHPAPEPVVETVAEGFDRPWGLAFLPGADQVLVTQLSGVLTVVDVGTGEVRDIDGVPEVDGTGQGGLLDVAVHPDFPDPAWVYLTYSATDGTGANSTHLARGLLDLDQGLLEDVEVLFAAEPFLSGGAHFGSRVVFDADGYLFMTIGDRGNKNFDDHPSQDPSNHLGTTIRLAPDGSVPEDNPFVDDPAVADEIYSYGHRNVQGMTVHPETGLIWQSDHGERDGDEINILEAGGNYGWPVAHTGCRYGTDIPVGVHPSEREDVVDPIHYWECGTGGFPPAGMAFYFGDEFPTWEGNLLVGGLASEYLARFTVDGRQIDEAEPLLAREGWRIRDVAVGPDGAIYLAIDAPGTPLVRLVNAAG
jgi:aldose sugar dehydrogenase